MAPISSQIMINDGMTAVLRKMNSALLVCLDSFEAMQNASANSMDTRSIELARSQLIGVNAELEDMADGQGRVNEALQGGAQAAGDLLGKVAQIAGAYVSLKTVADFATSAIEDVFEAQNINTQLATSLKNIGMGKADYDKLTAAAGEYGMYAETAMTGAAAEFATYLSDSDAIETMMGTLSNYMAGMSGGGALDTSQVVDYATQLGKVLNGTYDGIAKKGFTVSEAQKAIIDGTATEAQIVAELGEEYLTMSSDMQAAAVVANIINESWGGLYENMANTPEGQLLSLKNTLDQMKEDMGGELIPYVLQLVQTVQANMPTIQALIDAAGGALGEIIPLLAMIINVAAAVAQFFVNNWSWIEPIVWGIVGALVAYEVVTKAGAAAMAIYTAAANVKGAADMIATGKTIAETQAQYGLNAALYACPIVNIISLIIALIVAIIAWVNHVGGLQNAWEICKAALIVAWDAIKVAWYATVYSITSDINKVLDFVDLLKLGWMMAGTAIANFIGDMKVSVLTILQSMINGAIDLINDFISVLNAVPGVSIDLIGHVSFAAEAAAQNEAEKQARASDLAKYKQDIESAKGVREAVLDAAKEQLDNSVAELGAAADELAALYAKSTATNSEDEVSPLEAQINDILSSEGEIAENTEDAAKALSGINEDLKYLRDAAEQEAINRFTTAEVKIDMSGMTNRIDSDMDLDGVLTTLTTGFAEALETTAEGVHA